jgi:hypothetical protein
MKNSSLEQHVSYKSSTLTDSYLHLEVFIFVKIFELYLVTAIRCRAILAVLAVAKVNETVSCMAKVNFYHPPLSVMYAEVNRLAFSFFAYCMGAFSDFASSVISCHSRHKCVQCARSQR